MRPVSPARAAAGLVVLLAVGCSGAEGPASSAVLPPCAGAAPAVAFPARFPSMLPLPPGTVVTSVEVRSETMVLSGVVPAELKVATAYFVEALPAAGFPLGPGDSEAGEAESLFTGHGYRGRWRLNGILDCPGAVTLTLILVPPS